LARGSFTIFIEQGTMRSLALRRFQLLAFALMVLAGRSRPMKRRGWKEAEPGTLPKKYVLFFRIEVELLVHMERKVLHITQKLSMQSIEST
jgi:hypothetical protein